MSRDESVQGGGCTFEMYDLCSHSWIKFNYLIFLFDKYERIYTLKELFAQKGHFCHCLFTVIPNLHGFLSSAEYKRRRIAVFSRTLVTKHHLTPLTFLMHTKQKTTSKEDWIIYRFGMRVKKCQYYFVEVNYPPIPFTIPNHLFSI